VKQELGKRRKEKERFVYKKGYQTVVSFTNITQISTIVLKEAFH